MGGGISKMAKQELVATVRDRYQQASKKDKGRILDEFTTIAGHHRKHGIRLLSGTADNKGKQAEGRRIYDDSVREAVIVVWCLHRDLEKLASSYANETGREIEETRVSWAGRV